MWFQRFQEIIELPPTSKSSLKAGSLVAKENAQISKKRKTEQELQDNMRLFKRVRLLERTFQEGKGRHAPGAPNFSKAVHFDSHLEHVRHFLQVDKPLAVSANSSPNDVCDNDTEFPFSEDESSNSQKLSFNWEIVLPNSPDETPSRLALPVMLQHLFLSIDNKSLIGIVGVIDLPFHKLVVARFTLDYWKTLSEVVAESSDMHQKNADDYDWFQFNISLKDQANLEVKTMFLCIRYSVNGREYWDNNNSLNFQVDFRKKPLGNRYDFGATLSAIDAA
jgi:hypothetical protein